MVTALRLIDNHSELANLTIGDSHTQYSLLAGRAGGQTLVGGSAVTDVLSLKGTSGNGTLTAATIQMLVGNAGGTVALTVLNNGNVGIGTTAPNYLLQLGTGTITPTGGFGGANALVKQLISDTTSEKYTQLAIQGPTNGGAAIEMYDGSGVAVADFGMNTTAKDFGFLNRMTSGIMQFYTHDGTSLAPRIYISSTGNVGIGTTAPATLQELENVTTITGATANGYAAALTLDPGYTAATAQTVTRHNYLDIQNPSLAGAGPAALTDACIMRFDAAIGTHKAVDAASTKTTPTAVDAWIKVNLNDVVGYVPCYLSKTA